MELHHEFEVTAAIEDAWPVFLDMPRLAPCLPGAAVTEVIDLRSVNGEAAVKVGPVNLRFTGSGEISQVEDSAHSAVLTASGSDAKGRGSAEAEVRFSLRSAAAGQTRVEVDTTLNLTGSVAQYGRASGLIDEIANQLIADFVRCLEADLGQETASGLTDVGELSPLPTTGRPIAGLTLFFRAMLARIKKWFTRS